MESHQSKEAGSHGVRVKQSAERIGAALLIGGLLATPVGLLAAQGMSATMLAAAQSDDDLPLSKDDLFGTDKPSAPEKAPAATPPQGNTSVSPASPPPQLEAAPAASTAGGKEQGTRFRGFVQFEPAYTYAGESHWSRAVLRNQIEALGQITPNLRWKASVRVDLDPVYMGSDFYPGQVREDQRFDVLLRENYLDTSFGDWELRIGKQNIVWGEVTGLFFADVVSAQDLRDFILPDFQTIRIPQWAVRSEYFKGDAHLELIWIPIASFDEIGKPGAEFYPFSVPQVPGFQTAVRSEDKPGRTIGNGNYGVRGSFLHAGWDIAAFYYRSYASFPTFYRDVLATPTPTLQFTPRYDRIWQAGATLSKDFGVTVLRAEAVYTGNRGYEVTRLTEADGVVKQNTLDYILSFDFVPFTDGRLNLQAFQRVFFDHDKDILFDETESGVSVLLSGKISNHWEPQILVIQSLNRNDRMIRPRMNWYPQQNLRVSFGVDIFVGEPLGQFGRYRDNDRVYGEIRYDF